MQRTTKPDCLMHDEDLKSVSPSGCTSSETPLLKVGPTIAARILGKFVISSDGLLLGIAVGMSVCIGAGDGLGVGISPGR